MLGTLFVPMLAALASIGLQLKVQHDLQPVIKRICPGELDIVIEEFESSSETHDHALHAGYCAHAQCADACSRCACCATVCCTSIVAKPNMQPRLLHPRFDALQMHLLPLREQVELSSRTVLEAARHTLFYQVEL